MSQRVSRPPGTATRALDVRCGSNVGRGDAPPVPGFLQSAPVSSSTHCPVDKLFPSTCHEIIVCMCLGGGVF